jgi:hypothetical protein
VADIFPQHPGLQRDPRPFSESNQPTPSVKTEYDANVNRRNTPCLLWSERRKLRCK